MKLSLLTALLIIVSSLSLLSQRTSTNVIRIDSIPASGILLNEGWKFHAGDNAEWGKAYIDDANWQPINPTSDIYDLPQIRTTAVGWLRLHLYIDSNLLHKPLALQLRQTLASEIYLNGVPVKKYGVVSVKSSAVRAWQPQFEPFGIQFDKPEQVIAVRFSIQPRLPYFSFVPPFNAFMLRASTIEGAYAYNKYDMRFDSFNYMEGAFFLLLFLIHLSFFIIYPKQKANIFFALATLFVGLGNILYVHIKHSYDVAYITYAAIVDSMLLWTLYNLFLFLAIHTLFRSRKGIQFWFICALFPLGVFVLFFSYKWGFLTGMVIPLFLSMAEALRIALQVYRNGNKGANIVIAGLAGYFIFYLIFVLMLYGVLPFPAVSNSYSLMDVSYHLSIVSIPISLSVYLSLQYAYTSKKLERKLVELQELLAKSLEQEREKKRLLAHQNEMLEQQVSERTGELKRSLQYLEATQSQLIQSEKMASLGELTAGIAHEIQNPLNFINNFSDVNTELIEELKNELLSDNKTEAISIADGLKDNEQKINHHGKRADAIVKGMLQHSRTSSGKKEPTDINALADEYLRLSYHGLKAKDKDFNAIIETSLDESIGVIDVVPQDLGRVLLNLYNNAFYAVNEKKKLLNGTFEPSVTVTIKRAGDKVEISVKDNGYGIRQKVVDKIFQPFFTTKPPGQGTGLGLSLSYDIIKAHGGEIKVESREGEGTVFTVLIPPVTLENNKTL